MKGLTTSLAIATVTDTLPRTNRGAPGFGDSGSAAMGEYGGPSRRTRTDAKRAVSDVSRETSPSLSRQRVELWRLHSVDPCPLGPLHTHDDKRVRHLSEDGSVEHLAVVVVRGGGPGEGVDNPCGLWISTGCPLAVHRAPPRALGCLADFGSTLGVTDRLRACLETDSSAGAGEASVPAPTGRGGRDLIGARRKGPRGVQSAAPTGTAHPPHTQQARRTI